MAAKKKTAAAAARTTAAAAKDSGVVRSVRFTDEQFAAIQKKAKAIPLGVSSFIRQAALNAAGVGTNEVNRAQTLAKSLRSVGRV